jgi:hypothetical protein
MRLTVHVENAVKENFVVKTNDGEKKTTKTMNTLSFNDVEKDDLQTILNLIEERDLGKPKKHYFSNQKIPGIQRKRKK